jgi:hypothetical protein
MNIASFLFRRAALQSAPQLASRTKRSATTLLSVLALVSMLVSTLALHSCRTPSGPDEKQLEEVLPNVVTLTLTEAGTTNRVTATWRKTGTAATAPVTIDTLRLSAGKSYTGTIEAKNDLVSPAQDLTAEYAELADEHQFFYTPQGDVAARLLVSITDRDSKNLPLGLRYNVVVGALGAGATTVRGSLNVVLGHFDPKEGNVKDGTKRSPESDIDVTLPVLVR